MPFQLRDVFIGPASGGFGPGNQAKEKPANGVGTMGKVNPGSRMEKDTGGRVGIRGEKVGNKVGNKGRGGRDAPPAWGNFHEPI